ncbi:MULTISPECIES: hypothetical protein [Pseudomonas]|uniref:hypothetical protein n=1 Tax=Pseudomonas TaxID=286 RepID=UPI0012385EB0|nr:MULTISPECIES: hypothetical protein [Pseudomonas]QIB51654.1 hypothetical protein G3M63_11710 [Pseudomonas sp. OIL-1]
MNRRKFLALSAATVSVAALGSAAIVFEDSHSFIPALLHEYIGDYQMTEEQENNFVDAFAEEYGEEKLAAVIGLYRIRSGTGLGTGYTNAKVDEFERKLVTDFLVTTDYLKKQGEPNAQVNFIGFRIPCNNPYATFDGLS